MEKDEVQNQGEKIIGQAKQRENGVKEATAARKRCLIRKKGKQSETVRDESQERRGKKNDKVKQIRNC